MFDPEFQWIGVAVRESQNSDSEMVVDVTYFRRLTLSPTVAAAEALYRGALDTRGVEYDYVVVRDAAAVVPAMMRSTM